MIVIIDYGMGNVGSIENMLKKNGVKATVSSEITDIENADKLILPGVGAFDNAVKNLNQLNLIPVLSEKVLDEKIPVLGICLGFQLLAKKSEEGTLEGLKWLDAEVVKFNFDESDTGLKIPHMGWNTVDIQKKSPLFHEMYEEPRFYFVHSYHFVCNNEDVLTTTFYGYKFVSSCEKDNIIGVQFHPEKSHRFGMKLLKNFVKYF